jgi:hypothetical protein
MMPMVFALSASSLVATSGQRDTAAAERPWSWSRGLVAIAAAVGQRHDRRRVLGLGAAGRRGLDHCTVVPSL